MNQEIKERLEQAAETAWEQDQKTNPSPVNPHAYVYGYKAGAQTILDNPGEWGLKEASDTWFRMVDELTKYGEALERIVDKYYSEVSEIGQPKWIAKDLVEIAKEALKTGSKQ